jgi:hypothetical protein
MLVATVPLPALAVSVLVRPALKIASPFTFDADLTVCLRVLCKETCDDALTTTEPPSESTSAVRMWCPAIAPERFNRLKDNPMFAVFRGLRIGLFIDGEAAPESISETILGDTRKADSPSVAAAGTAS